MGYLSQITLEFKDSIPIEFSSIDNLKHLVEEHIHKVKEDYYISLYEYTQEDSLTIYFELYCDGRREHFDWELEQLTDLLVLWRDKIEDLYSSNYVDCDSWLDLDTLDNKIENK